MNVCVRLVIALLLGMSSTAFAMDRDLDNDGRWDFGAGGSDRDMDNDGRWDFNAGGSDRDVDNDGRWDHDKAVLIAIWITTAAGTSMPAARIGISTTMVAGTTTKAAATVI